MSIDTKTDPRNLVTKVSLVTLIEAVTSDGHPFAFIEMDDDTVQFICPCCGRCNSNGGTATIIDKWRWRCRPCRHTGTRYIFERLVLEDADIMDRFYRLLAEGAL